MKNIFWCKSCVVMSTRPRVTFNEKGICSACQWAEEKKKINWNEREKKLDKLLSDQKTNPNLASSLASLISIGRVMVTPTPTAGPFMAAIIGFEQS